MDIVSKSFLNEDLNDPIAISMFVHSDNYEVSHDEEIAESIARNESADLDEEFDAATEELVDDCEYGCSTSVLDNDIDMEEDIDNDISDEDGEIIDIIDGII